MGGLDHWWIVIGAVLLLIWWAMQNRINRPSFPPGTTVDDLIRQGHRLQAIKLLREQTGVSLVEAKRLIEEKASPPTPPTEVGPTVEQLIREGNKLEAIKVWRAATGMGLKEAKDAVDAKERELNL